MKKYALLTNKTIKKIAKDIKLVVFDVDGVLTDGKLHYLENGEEIKVFNAVDGHGIKQLAKFGIKTAIITGSNADAIDVRAKMLKIDALYKGIEDKLPVLKKIIADSNVLASEVAYVGDDHPDIPCIEFVALGVAVSNATKEVKKVANYITSSSGGDGAAREVCDLILKAQNYNVY